MVGSSKGNCWMFRFGSIAVNLRSIKIASWNVPRNADIAVLQGCFSLPNYLLPQSNSDIYQRRVSKINKSIAEQSTALKKGPDQSTRQASRWTWCSPRGSRELPLGLQSSRSRWTSPLLLALCSGDFLPYIMDVWDQVRQPQGLDGQASRGHPAGLQAISIDTCCLIIFTTTYTQ